VKEKSKMMMTIAIVGGVVFALIVCGAFIAAKCRKRRSRYINNLRVIEINADGDPRERDPRANRARRRRNSRRNRDDPEQVKIFIESMQFLINA